MNVQRFNIVSWLSPGWSVDPRVALTSTFHASSSLVDIPWPSWPTPLCLLAWDVLTKGERLGGVLLHHVLHWRLRHAVHREEHFLVLKGEIRGTSI